MEFLRRKALLGAAALAAMGSALSAVAQASPPPQRGANPPRFLRLKLGDMEVTTLLDGAMGGTNANIQNFFPDSRPEEITPLRARAVIQNRGWRGVIHRTPLE